MVSSAKYFTLCFGYKKRQKEYERPGEQQKKRVRRETERVRETLQFRDLPSYPVSRVISPASS